MNHFKKIILGTTLAASLCMIGIVQAQQGPRIYDGYCNGDGYYHCGMGYREGNYGLGRHGHGYYGHGHKRGYARGGRSMMSPAEFQNHRDNLYAAQSYNECVTIQNKHHEMMVKRARAQNINLPINPRNNICEFLNSEGYFK